MVPGIHKFGTPETTEYSSLMPTGSLIQIFQQLMNWQWKLVKMKISFVRSQTFTKLGTDLP